MDDKQLKTLLQQMEYVLNSQFVDAHVKLELGYGIVAGISPEAGELVVMVTMEYTAASTRTKFKLVRVSAPRSSHTNAFEMAYNQLLNIMMFGDDYLSFYNLLTNKSEVPIELLINQSTLYHAEAAAPHKADELDVTDFSKEE